MVSLLIALAVGAAALTALCWYVREGFRNGDRPDDAPVRAALRSSGQPGEQRPIAVVAVRNRGRVPVLAAVAVRPALLPGRLAGAVASGVARRTARRAYWADGFGTVAVVAAGQHAELSAPVPAAARRYLVTVLVGQRPAAGAPAADRGRRGRRRMARPRDPRRARDDRLDARLTGRDGGRTRVAVAPG